MKHIMTIDLEDWFHCFEHDQNRWSSYEDRIVPIAHKLLNILKDAGATATFFVLADIAIRHPELIREIKQQGHEIGSHGSSHTLIYTQSKEAFRSDVLQAKEEIEKIIDTRVISYRAPFFSITGKSLWALEILRDIGIKYDSSIFPVVNHRYGIAGANPTPHFVIDGLLELPMSIYKLWNLNIPIAGGAYFRIFPFWLTRRLLRLKTKEQSPIIFYLHPWELDTGQPKVQRYTFQGIRNYWNLDKTEERLTKLLREYDFVSIQDYYEHKNQ